MNYGNSLTEAFDDLKKLDEEVFDVDEKGIEALKNFEDSDDIEDTISIIDPEADSKEDLEDNYVGKAILDCCVCHSKLYKNKEDVKLNDDGTLANIDEECPFCYSTEGFKVIGEVADYNPAKADVTVDGDEEADVTVDGDEEADITVDGKKVEKDNDKDDKKEESLKKKLGEDWDWNGDVPKIAEEMANKFDSMNVITIDDFDEQLELACKKLGVNLDYENDKVTVDGKEKSIYGDFEGDIRIILDMWGYHTIYEGDNEGGLEKDNDTVNESLGSWIKAKKYQHLSKKDTSKMTPEEKKKHDLKKKSALAGAKVGAEYKTSNGKPNATQNVINNVKHDQAVNRGKKGAEAKKTKSIANAREEIRQSLKNVGKSDKDIEAILKKAGLTEGFEGVTIDTGDQEIEVKTRDKVVEPQGETIAPLDDKTKAEIEANNNEVDADVDDFDEEEFDKLGEAYLKKAYGNVKSYKTVGATSEGNQLTLEGVITFASGKSKKTSFIFESKDITRSGKARFIGENAQISKGKKAFTVTGTLNKGKFISESLSYNYRVMNKANGVSQRVSGTVSNRE